MKENATVNQFISFPSGASKVGYCMPDMWHKQRMHCGEPGCSHALLALMVVLRSNPSLDTSLMGSKAVFYPLTTSCIDHHVRCILGFAHQSM